MYHFTQQNGTLRVLDSQRERFSLKSRNAALPPGHYRLPMLERFAPATRHYGLGRIFIARLSDRDVASLLSSEKCESIFEERLKFDRQPSLAIGQPPEECSIHGGGQLLSPSVAVARFQPLTDTNGIRVHNIDLIALLDFLEPRLRIGQLVILSVFPGAA